MADLDLARRFVEATHRLSGPGDMSAKLHEAVALAAGAVPGCDYAGMTVLDRRTELRTPAYTTESALEADSTQYRLAEGPCLETARNGVSWLQIDDVESDHRWPRFAHRARLLGIRSVFSCALVSPRGRLGALNLYAERPRAFGSADREIALLFATHAGVLLSTSRMEDSLRTAIDSREHIGIAMGILMERHKVTMARAFEMLSRVSQDTNTKVRELAARVIETGEDPAPD
ncbi:GAF and ANTAR domain-containing protein [Streptomonospora algeriensis]|uniref:GAF and ANTAR domain-containing protein n=1 Tax=Streptomonospora algeriensis TaxID=995084 RepID=A0ABW3BDI7_9ACTN